MDNQKSFCRWLDLIVAMAGDRDQTVDGMAAILGTSKRNAYYVLRTLQDYGFALHRSHGRYSLDASSPFFQEIACSVNFTYDQAQYLYTLLSSLNSENTTSGLLRRKLQRFYHLDEEVGDTAFLPGEHRNYVALLRAIRAHRIVTLHDYASSNSRTVSDRTVEPFTFIGGNSDVRAYEINTGRNKTFKLSRIGKVEVLDARWANEDKHKKVFTDMFMFSGEVRHHIKLTLDLVAHNLMQEEYPHASGLMRINDQGKWVLEADVANYVGIGRFILGLYDNIEIIENDGLRQYIKERIEAMGEALKTAGSGASAATT